MPTSDERANFNRVKRQDRRVKESDPSRVHMLMRSAFRRGLLSDDESMTEASLISRFGATREAVRESLREFSRQGLIRRQPRRGTWFTANPGQVLGDRMFPLLRGARSPISTIVSLEETIVSGSDIIREILQVDAPEMVRYHQLILQRGLPAATRTSYVPLAYLEGSISDLIDSSGNDGGVLGYEGDFEMVFGSPIGKVDNVIEAVSSLEPITALGIQPGDMLLSRESLVYDVNGIPRILSFTSYRASFTSIAISGDFSL